MFKVGQSWKYEWSISNELYQKFLILSNDFNPMHTDPNYAKSKGYKDKIIHGNLLSCFISFFVGELLPIKNLVIIGQSIKYHNAMYINDIIQLKVVTSKFSDSVNFIQFEFQFSKNNLCIASGDINVKVL